MKSIYKRLLSVHKKVSSIYFSKSFIIETIGILVYSILLAILILHKVVFQPGFIAVRDTAPVFYSNRFYVLSLLFSGEKIINIPMYMDNSILPLIGLLWLNLITPETFNKITYLLFPFIIAVPSMYFSIKYFLVKIFNIRSGKQLSLILVSLCISTLYAVNYTSFYYSFWFNYAAFYGFFPLLLMILDKFFSSVTNNSNSILKNSLIAAVGLSLTTTDPRGMIYSFIIFLLYFLYYLVRNWESILKLFVSTFFTLIFYIILNLRTIIALYVNLHSYSLVSQNIMLSQFWLNFYFFPIPVSMEGLGLFFPSVYPETSIYNAIFAALIPVFGILSILLYSNRKISNRSSIPLFLIIIYILATAFIANPFGIISKIILILAQTQLYNYLWLIYPTYVSMVIMAPIYILAAITLFRVLVSHINLLVKLFIIFLLLLSQIAFIFPVVSSGNYNGYYQPQPVPKALENVAKILLNASGYTIICGPSVTFWSNVSFGTTLYLSLPHVNPDLTIIQWETKNISHLGRILAFFGVQYILVHIDGKSYYENIKYEKLLNFLNRQKDLKLVYNMSFIKLYQNLDFKSLFPSEGVYVLVDYPLSLNTLNQINLTNSTLIPEDSLSPSELSFLFKHKLLSGIVGYNYSTGDFMSLFFQNWSVNIFSLVKKLPFPTNWTVQSTSLDGEEVNFIASAVPAKLAIHIRPGTYVVLVEYITSSEGGAFEIGGGTSSVNVSTFNTIEYIKWTNPIIMNLSSGVINLKNLGGYSMVEKVIIIPYNIYQSMNSSLHRTYNIYSSYNGNILKLSLKGKYNTTILYNGINILYPSKGKIFSSIAYSVFLNKPQMQKEDVTIVLKLTLLNVLVVIITIWFLYFYKKFSIYFKK